MEGLKAPLGETGPRGLRGLLGLKGSIFSQALAMEAIVTTAAKLFIFIYGLLCFVNEIDRSVHLNWIFYSLTVPRNGLF